MNDEEGIFFVLLIEPKVDVASWVAVIARQHKDLASAEPQPKGSRDSGIEGSVFCVPWQWWWL